MSTWCVGTNKKRDLQKPELKNPELQKPELQKPELEKPELQKLEFRSRKIRRSTSQTPTTTPTEKISFIHSLQTSKTGRYGGPHPLLPIMPVTMAAIIAQ